MYSRKITNSALWGLVLLALSITRRFSDIQFRAPLRNKLPK
jgi:hypothetical protein